MNHEHLCLIATCMFTLIAGAHAESPASVPPAHVDRTIVREVIVDAPRAEVWKAWTTPEGITTFFGAAASIELRPGGPFEIYFNLDAPEGQRGSEGCEVLSWLDQEMLSFTWNAPPKFRDVRMQRSFVVVQFADVASANGANHRNTRVTLTHAGFGSGEQWDEVYDYFDNAWTYVTDNLVKRFNRSGGDEDDDVRHGTPREPRPWKHYVYFVRPADESFLTRTEYSDAEQAAFAGHVEHIRNLVATDKLICAGPCFAPTIFPDSAPDMVPLGIPAVGIVVFKAHDDAEAKAIMESDPAIAAGIFKAQVNPFNLAFVRP